MMDRLPSVFLVTIWLGLICVAGVQSVVNDLTLRRIVYPDAEGVSPCITRPDGSAPDLSLSYEAVFLKGDQEVVNISSLHQEPDETGSWSLYCLTPVPLADLYYEGDLTVMVLGRSETNDVVAMAKEDVSLRNTTVAFHQEGNEALRVEWSGEAQRKYGIQFWLDPASTLGSWMKTPTIVETSGNIECHEGRCIYYHLSPVASGDHAAEVLDKTESLIQSSRSSKMAMEPNWDAVEIESVVISTVSTDSNKATKTLNVTARSSKKVQGRFKAVVINDLNRSDFLESDFEHCLPFESGCIVEAIETLTDPAGEGPITDLWLLLTQPEQATASLVTISDLHVQVGWVSSGSVQLSWDSTAVTSQFSVQLIPAKGTSPLPSDVTCGLGVSTCQIVFGNLVNGNYTAEVTYESDVKTALQVRFQVTDGIPDCNSPFEVLEGRCMLIDTVYLGSWYDMKHFCSQLGGQLAKVDGQDFMYHIVKYLHDSDIDSHSVWIGGSDADSEGSFRWMDGEDMRLGTPYWGYADGEQRPLNDTERNCVSMNKDLFFFFSDDPCEQLNGALCEKL